MRQLYVLILLLVLSSCWGGKEEGKTLFSRIQGAEKGDIRGVSLGMSLDEVKEVEAKEHLYSSSSNELQYKVPLADRKGKSRGHVVVFYSFDEYGLFEVHIDVHPDREKTAAELFDRFSDHFDQRYGKSSEGEYGYMTWLTSSQAGHEVEVSLINATENRGEPLLSITFFERYEEEGA